MTKHILNLNKNFISINDLCLLFHKQAKFCKVLQEYIQQQAINDTAPFILKDKTIKQIPIFHVGMKEGKEYGVYLFKKALPFFLKSHLNKLIEIGVERERIYSLLNWIPTLTAEEKVQKRDNLVLLNQIATKFSNNTHVVSLLTQYIKDNWLTDTYTLLNPLTNQSEEKHMFCFSPSLRGRSAVYLYKEALPHFLNKYQQALKEKKLELEEQNNFISLRGLSVLLGKNNNEKELFQFIQQHLDETFEMTDKNGFTRTVNLFNTVQHGSCFYLNIYKQGLLPFIKKYRKEFVDMGFLMADVLSNEFDKKDFIAHFKPLKFFIKKLSSDKEVQEKLYQLLEQKFNQEKQTEETHPFLVNYRNTLFIKKTAVASFFKRYKKNLLQHGANKVKLEHLANEKQILQKTEEMISFRECCSRLKTSPYKIKSLLTLIRKYIETETFLPSASSKKEEKTFVYCKNSSVFSYMFKNEVALNAFLKNHKEELMELGFKKEFIEQISGEKSYPHITDDFIFLSDLKSFLHVENPNFHTYILENCLDQTYEEISSTGQKTSKPMFLYMQGKRIGFGGYAIDKKALKQFVSTCAQPLKIRQAVQEAIFFEKPIELKKETYVTIPILTESLGMSSKRAPLFIKELKNKFIHDTALVPTANGPLHCPIFNYGYTQSGQITLYIDTTHLISFVEKRKNDLIKIGFKEEKLNALIQHTQTNPLFILNKDRLLRLKKQIYLNNHPTNRQKGN
ncbi:MAG: hypothetical protein J6V53_05500 [Alphaproteobacteria bacterium]|nr:hypothetical protein [Alphaproteobacteria bacterium]